MFQLPANETDKSVWLPVTDSGHDRIKFSECEIFIDPENRSSGVQPCVDGYEFIVNDNEWNIVAEVSTIFCGTQPIVLKFSLFKMVSKTNTNCQQSYAILLWQPNRRHVCP